MVRFKNQPRRVQSSPPKAKIVFSVQISANQIGPSEIHVVKTGVMAVGGACGSSDAQVEPPSSSGRGLQ